MRRANNVIIASLLLCSGLWGAQAAGSDESTTSGYHTETIRVPRFGLITKFWPQEAIGAPEAHTLLAQLAANKFEFYQPRIAVFMEEVALSDAFKNVRISKELGDKLTEEAEVNLRAMQDYADNWEGDEFAAAFENYHKIVSGNDSAHIAAVANLLVGKAPVGISKHGVIAAIANLEYEEAGKGQSRVYLTKNTTPHVDIVHLSVSLDNPHEYQAIAALSERHGNFLLIGSAGNDYPQPVFGDNAISDIAFISVGSCNPAGSPSHFSQCGNLNILAPSDDYSPTYKHNSSTLETFGGTSAASPLVSGAVADFLAILPSQKITYPQLEKLLHATAIPVAVDPEIDGDVKVLNYYKLLRVALRIRYAVENNLTSDKVQQMIEDAATYDFSAEAEEAKQLALKSAGEDYFNYLRQAFFLNPHDSEIRTLLSNIYRTHGLQAQAIYYGSPDRAMTELLTIDAHKYRQHMKNVYDADVFTADGHLTAEYRDFVLAAIKINSSKILHRTLDRISVDFKAGKHQINLIAALGINPAELAREKPDLFKLLKKYQKRLRR